jgi:hypothetical protein
MRRLLALALTFMLAGCADRPPVTDAPGPSADLSSAALQSTPTPTPTPTPPLTGDVGQWTALRWEAPVFTRQFETIGDVIAWNGGYVSVGQSQNAQGEMQAAAWASADWSSWDQTLVDAPVAGGSSLLRVLGLGSRLVGIGWSGVQHCLPPEGEAQVCDPLPIAVWSSADGRSWVHEAPTAAFDRAQIVGAVAADGFIIAVGGTGWNEPGIWTSADGTSWQAEKLPAEQFANAHLMSIATVPGGMVVTGSTGGKEPGCCVGGQSDTTPAAWFSTDGLRWQRAAVVGGAAAIGDAIGPVFVGANGMIALGQGENTSGWGSTNGRLWTAARPQTGDPIFAQASDGRRIIGTSFADGDHLAMWVSSDGTTWSALKAIGASDKMPSWSGDTGPTADEAFLFPDALGLVGQDGTGRTPMWLATGVTGP